jgi:hypothetical protein
VQHRQITARVSSAINPSIQMEQTPSTVLRDQLAADRTLPFLIQPQPDKPCPPLERVQHREA